MAGDLFLPQEPLGPYVQVSDVAGGWVNVWSTSGPSTSTAGDPSGSEGERRLHRRRGPSRSRSELASTLGVWTFSERGEVAMQFQFNGPILSLVHQGSRWEPDQGFLLDAVLDPTTGTLTLV